MIVITLVSNTQPSIRVMISTAIVVNDWGQLANAVFPHIDGI